MKIRKLIRTLLENEVDTTSWSDSKGRTIKIGDLCRYKNRTIQIYGEKNGGLQYKEYGKFRNNPEVFIIPSSYKPKYFGFLTIIS